MPEIYAFTASPGHNGLVDVFAIGDPGDDDSGTAVFLSRAAPGGQWPPWANAGLPDLGAIGLQGIAGPDRYGHILARAAGREAAKDHGDLWFRERGENDDIPDWQELTLPPPAAPDDPRIFGWISGATTGQDGTIDVADYAGPRPEPGHSGLVLRPGQPAHLRRRPRPGHPRLLAARQAQAPGPGPGPGQPRQMTAVRQRPFTARPTGKRRRRQVRPSRRQSGPVHHRLSGPFRVTTTTRPAPAVLRRATAAAPCGTRQQATRPRPGSGPGNTPVCRPDRPRAGEPVMARGRLPPYRASPAPPEVRRSPVHAQSGQ